MAICRAELLCSVKEGRNSKAAFLALCLQSPAETAVLHLWMLSKELKEVKAWWWSTAGGRSLTSSPASPLATPQIQIVSRQEAAHSLAQSAQHSTAALFLVACWPFSGQVMHASGLNAIRIVLLRGGESERGKNKPSLSGRQGRLMARWAAVQPLNSSRIVLVFVFFVCVVLFFLDVPFIHCCPAMFGVAAATSTAAVRRTQPERCNGGIWMRPAAD